MTTPTISPTELRKISIELENWIFCSDLRLRDLCFWHEYQEEMIAFLKKHRLNMNGTYIRNFQFSDVDVTGPSSGLSAFFEEYLSDSPSESYALSFTE
jgi:hypothetical protein